MKQTWHDLLFAHWPLPPAIVRSAIPTSLELDLRDGEAWLGIVPFRMSGVRARWMPPVPGTSAFPELNLRTYVRVDDKPGVYFFCLEAANGLAVAVARRWFQLPYFRAAMSCEREGDDIRYASRRTDRRGAPAEFVARYGPRGPRFESRPGTLEHWLTERYCLYTVGRAGEVRRGDIHHHPWPLQPAAAQIERNTIAHAHRFELPARDALLHFARRLDVVVWPPVPAESDDARRRFKARS